jgi:serine protease Do
MVQEIDADRAKTLKLHEEAGVEVTRVEPDSPAEHAGLKIGDVIMQYNGLHVEGMEQFSRLVHETPAGREVKLDIIRAGMPQVVTARIGARRPAPFAALQAPPTERFEMHMPDLPRSFMSWRSSALGIECESLEGQLAQYFGVKEGVLVRSVTKGSAAEKAGIKAGDVITKIDDAKVAAPSDISSRIRSMRGKSIPMVLMRDRVEMTLTVAVEDDDRVEWRGPAGIAPVR